MSKPTAAVLLVIVLCLAGCAASPADDAVPVADVVTTASMQDAALADGTVDLEEYTDGFERYRDCLAASGYELEPGPYGEPVGTMVDTHLEASVPEAAVTSGVEDDCYQAEYAEVDIAWQVAHQDETLQAAQWRACLEENGLTPEPTSELAYAQIFAADLETECLE